MEVKTIARLADIMSQHELTELEVHEGEVLIRLSRESASARNLVAPVVLEQTSEASFAKEVPAAKTLMITAPMPGTFYTSGAPELPAFVKEGDHVGMGTIVCIVEAMKVMNEVKSEIAGMVGKILAKNGSPVEFGQPLFEIKID
ncbi:MAG: acetyl-CoA carboxylase biotin carboxyl carrier protein [Lentisphaeria bacterium]